MKLISCNASHLQIIIDLTKEIWPKAYGTILAFDQLEYMIAKFYNELALLELMEKGHVFYLAQDDEARNIGFVSYEIDCVSAKTKIHKLYLLPEKQGAGLGRKLIEFVTKKAIENKQHAIFLNVNKYNKARHFYEKLGFTVVKDEVIAIGNGYVMDDFVMEIGINDCAPHNFSSL